MSASLGARPAGVCWPAGPSGWQGSGHLHAARPQRDIGKRANWGIVAVSKGSHRTATVYLSACHVLSVSLSVFLFLYPLSINLLSLCSLSLSLLSSSLSSL